MKLKSILAAAVLAAAGTGSAFADAIPYPGGGENATTYSFTAAADGNINAYFLGSGASYDEYLGMLVNGTPTGITGLQNHSTAIGTVLDLGAVHAGDVLTFFIFVQTTGATWYSTQGLNADGSNHVYSTSFSGSGTVPAGTYIGFEDLPATGSDFNYADEQFSFTNVATSVVPEPGGVALLLAGLGLVGAMARRRRG
ncbi:MAG: PEP-CTERM sorting domain-containing protein [Betaproteobacteria bacterium]